MGEGVKYVDGKFQVACPSCGKTNAIPLEKVDKGPVCGSCKEKLSAPGGTVELTDQNFRAFVENAPVPVLVDFWAPWCGPCRQMGPVLESLAAKRSGKLIVGKLNTDASPVTPGGFGIQAIPTLILLKQGKEAGRKVGAVPAASLDEWLSATS